MNRPMAVRKDHQLWMTLVALLVIAFFVLRAGVSETFNVTSIPAVRAKQLIDQGAVVVDVRGPKTYGESHIPGAISVPLSALETAIPRSLADAKTKAVVVYCGDGVTIGPKGTYLLNQAGYQQAVNLEGGFKSWKSAGYEVR